MQAAFARPRNNERVSKSILFKTHFGTTRSRLTPRISSTVEDNGSVSVLLGAQDIVELDSEAVQVANVQRAKVVVERVVQKSVVNGEVARWVSVGHQRCRSSSVRISR